MPQQHTVALVDPEWVGHHATYFRAFIDAFIEAGARVIALCPAPEELADCLDRHGDQWLHLGKLEDPGESRILPGKEHDPVITRKRWLLASETISLSEQQSGWKADFVFFAWLDSYLRFMPWLGVANCLQGRPWTGLYFRNQHLTEAANGLLTKVKRRLKGDFVLRAPDCRMLSVVDEQALPYVERVAEKPVRLMPDITDETTGDPNVPLAQTIREKAQGRRVIGIVGLEKRKGFLTLLRVAREAEKQGKPWFFAFTGVLWWQTLSDDESTWVREYLDDPPQNIHLDENGGFLPDGEVFNGVASTFDVFFAAYWNSLYNGSSNVLTKAALLKIPTVVTEGAVLEERVKTFRMGLAIPEDDAERCLQAIACLLDGVDWEGLPLRPRYADYFALHSREKLVEHAKEMISLALAP